jgi:ferric-dicitrate binding protein FerR (iron transport regulator)
VYVDELIDRVRRGEASKAEMSGLAAWRRASPANERQYRHTARLLDAGRALGIRVVQHPPPSAADIVASLARGSRSPPATSVSKVRVVDGTAALSTSRGSSRFRRRR